MFNYLPGSLSAINQKALKLSALMLTFVGSLNGDNTTYPFPPDKCPNYMLSAGDPYCVVPNANLNRVLFISFLCLIVIVPVACCWCFCSKDQSTNEELRPILPMRR
jgi:hypothetical protein